MYYILYTTLNKNMSMSMYTKEKQKCYLTSLHSINVTARSFQATTKINCKCSVGLRLNSG